MYSLGKLFYLTIVYVCVLQGSDLFDAAERGNLTEVLAALDAGVDLNWKNKKEVPVSTYILTADILNIVESSCFIMFQHLPLWRATVFFCSS